MDDTEADTTYAFLKSKRTSAERRRKFTESPPANPLAANASPESRSPSPPLPSRLDRIPSPEPVKEDKIDEAIPSKEGKRGIGARLLDICNDKATAKKRRRSSSSSRDKKQSRSRSPKRRPKSPKRRSKSPVKKRLSRSREVSKKSRSRSKDRRRKSRSVDRKRKRSNRSLSDSRSPPRRTRSPPRRRSRTPRKRSRSPCKRSRSPRKRSRSPRKRSRSPRKRSRSPRRKSRSLRRSKSPRRSGSPRRRRRDSSGSPPRRFCSKWAKKSEGLTRAVLPADGKVKGPREVSTEEVEARLERHMKSVKERAAEEAKKINLPGYLNPAMVNVHQFKQVREKRKLLWSKVAEKKQGGEWTGAFEDQNNDEKFRRLMGINENLDSEESAKVQQSRKVLDELEKEYEKSRVFQLSRGAGGVTGIGLGFGSSMVP